MCTIPKLGFMKCMVDICHNPFCIDYGIWVLKSRNGGYRGGVNALLEMRVSSPKLGSLNYT